MNSREVIDRTINFTRPDRIGLCYWVNDIWHDDFCIAGVEHPFANRNRRIEGNLELWEDEWNNTWARVATDKTTKGEVYRGAIEEWQALKNYQIPDLDRLELFDNARAKFSAAPQKYKLGFLPGFCFALARKIRRLDNYLLDIKLETENVCELNRRIEKFLAKMIARYAASGADGVFFCEDWGTQERLLISPADWIAIFKPGFARLCSVARKNKLTVWMHSCGYINEIIPHLIEVGINVLQLDQPELMNMERLGRQFAGKVTFWSPCDIQKVLPTGDRRLIEESVRRMVEYLATDRGGLIAKSYGDSHADLQSIGTSPESNEFALNCFIKYGNKRFAARE
jgi:uroporphyrinogen decarboxylase